MKATIICSGVAVMLAAVWGLPYLVDAVDLPRWTVVPTIITALGVFCGGAGLFGWGLSK